MSMLQKQKIGSKFRLRDECHEVPKRAFAPALKPLLVLLTCALAFGVSSCSKNTKASPCL